MSSKPPERIVIPGLDRVPIIGQSELFVVCNQGHVNEGSQHPQVMFREANGNVLQSVLCGRCLFEYQVQMAGGEMLPRGTSRKEATWKARDMRKASCFAIGLPCCGLAKDAPEGEPHAGSCTLFAEEKIS